MGIELHLSVALCAFIISFTPASAKLEQSWGPISVKASKPLTFRTLGSVLLASRVHKKK